ncbi:MAG: hypothetical protein ACN4G0_02740 [Polyangiales bacterium]
MNRFLLLAIAVAAIPACSAKHQTRSATSVTFVVESDPGLHLAGVKVYLEGRPLGETDSTGSLTAEISDRVGSALRLEHDCPTGHEVASGSRLLRLRPFGGVDTSNAGPLQITLRCRPLQRRAVFIVRATNGDDLPVLLDGEIVARTNSSGIAHFSTSAPPETDFLVQLDTRDRPDLRPKTPGHLRALSTSDQIFLIDQSFEQRTESRRKRFQKKKISKIE